MSFDESIGDHVIASQQVSPLKCWPVWKISTDNAGSDNPERGEKEKKKKRKREASFHKLYLYFFFCPTIASIQSCNRGYSFRLLNRYVSGYGQEI